jgi:hypothetical protein
MQSPTRWASTVFANGRHLLQGCAAVEGDESNGASRLNQKPNNFIFLFSKTNSLHVSVFLSNTIDTPDPAVTWRSSYDNKKCAFQHSKEDASERPKVQPGDRINQWPDIHSNLATQAFLCPPLSLLCPQHSWLAGPGPSCDCFFKESYSSTWSCIWQLKTQFCPSTAHNEKPGGRRGWSRLRRLASFQSLGRKPQIKMLCGEPREMKKQ